MAWTKCRSCGKECDLPEPDPSHNPQVAGKCIDCIKKMQDEHQEKKDDGWFA